MSNKITVAFSLALGVASSSASATLQVRPGGMIYDTDINITWLANPPSQKMTWSDAVSWASNLLIAGYSDWRLPLGNDCRWWGCNTSELGHLFYGELGGISFVSLLRAHNSSLALFGAFAEGQNGYWSGTSDADNTRAVSFLFNDGYTGIGPGAAGWQSATYKTQLLSVIAVRDGDVTPVPEPSTYALLLAGIPLIVMKILRKRNTSRPGPDV